MSTPPRTRARAVFAEWLERTGDHRAAATWAGISERTGRRWKREHEQGRLVALPPAGVAGLPAERTRFFGREAELDQLMEQLAVARLVTVLGPPGVGKTRLAAELARVRLPVPAGGAGFADLTSARTADDAAIALAAALELPLSGADPIATVSRGLRARGPCLWILDNFEQLADVAAETVGRWLDDAPSAQFLATSRTALRLAGESVIALAPLPVDRAVELFHDRARLADSRYRRRPEYGPAVAEIVRRVDGLPLAVELAAARTALLAPPQLRRALDRPHALDGGPGDAPSRHRSMAAALRSACEPLAAAERSALAQCSVFAGPFFAADAEAVIDSGGAGSTFDCLQRLRDRSLLQAHVESTGVRLELLAVVRQFAAEQLSDDERRAVEARHAAWCVGGAVQAAEDLDRLAQLRPDLLAVCRRSLAGEPALAVRAAVALDPLHSTRGPHPAHLALIDAALSAAEPSGIDAELLAQARMARGRTLLNLGRPADAEPEFARALELVRADRAHAVGDRQLEGRAELYLGIAEYMQWKTEAARERLARALALHRAAGDRWAEARARSNLGADHYWQGRTAMARDELERALVLHRQVGDRAGAANTLSILGVLYHAPPHQDLARGYYGEALAIYREQGNWRREASVIANLGLVEHEAGNLCGAERHYQQALAAFRELSARGLEGVFMTYLGAVYHERGLAAEAERCYREAIELARANGDSRYAALAWAHLGALAAHRGDVQLARSAFADAALAARGIHEAPLDAALRIHRAHLEIDDAADALAAAERAQLVGGQDVRLAMRLFRTNGRRGDRQVLAPRALTTVALRIAADGRSVRTAAGRVADLGRRAAPRRILQRLVAERIQSPGRALPREVLFEAGWSNQRVSPAAAASRVHVAIATLRKLGLRDLVLSTDEGYLLDPRVPVEVDPSSG